MRYVIPPKYTRSPVKTEAMKVPRIANVTMAPKLEKNGLGERMNPD